MTSPLGQQMEYQFRLHDRAGRKFLTDLREQLRVAHQPTYEHCLRVGDIARRFALYLGVEKDVAEDFGLAVSCHDIGKLLVPPEILYKTDRMTRPEGLAIKAHTQNGVRLLEDSPHPLVRQVAEIAENHHEQWCGRGYAKKRQAEIPVAAQIASMCDMLDALVSTRHYKPAQTFRSSLLEMAQDRRRIYDPDLLRPFLKFARKAFAADLEAEKGLRGWQDAMTLSEDDVRHAYLQGKQKKKTFVFPSRKGKLP